MQVASKLPKTRVDPEVLFNKGSAVEKKDKSSQEKSTEDFIPGAFIFCSSIEKTKRKVY